MLTINLGTIEYFDSTSNEFLYEEGGTVRFEYTLKVVYDWEFKWRKPFLKGGLTNEEAVDFYKRMALDPLDERFLTAGVIKLLADYVKDDSTATTFSSYEGSAKSGPTRGKVYSAEEIYALMFSANVPLEFETRNLNRLLVVLKIIAAQNNPPEKMSAADTARQNRELNEQRRKQYGTKG